MTRFEAADRSTTPLRTADGAVGLVGAPSAAASLGRGRGTAADVLCVAVVDFVCSKAPLNIGAGCKPGCINSTLTRTVIVSRAPATTPNASRAFQPSTGTRPLARLPQGTLFLRGAHVMALFIVRARSFYPARSCQRPLKRTLKQVRSKKPRTSFHLLPAGIRSVFLANGESSVA